MAEDDATVAAVSAAVEAAIADAFRRFYPKATVAGLAKVQSVFTPGFLPNR